MNPYVIIVGLVLAIGAWFGGQSHGYGNGVAAQKVADQKTIDDTNDKLTTQKAEAAKLLADLSKQLLDKIHNEAVAKAAMESERENNLQNIEQLRRHYDGNGLFFTTTKDSGCGSGSAGSDGKEVATPKSAETVVRKLPDKIERDLRTLVFDADVLRANYQLCYEYVNQ